MSADQRAILAAAAPWLAALLNVVPGLGTGYIYQRRWQAYWITSALATGWFLLGLLLAPPPENLTAPVAQPDQLIGLAGLLLLAAITAVEAALCGRRARQADGAP